MTGKPRVTDWRDAIRDSELDRTTKLVAFVLSTYVNGAGTAYPSKLTLARGASLGAGRRAVDDAVKRLVAAGYLSTRRSRTYIYEILLPESHPDAPSGVAARCDSKRAGVARTEVESRTNRPRDSHGDATKSVESERESGEHSDWIDEVTAGSRL